MSILRLKIREGCEEPYVEFHVDGDDLGARVKAAFGEAGFDDVLPWAGGDYSISDTVLGERVRSGGAEGVILFACGCGYSACSCVRATLQVSDETVAIQEISTWRHGENLIAPLPPIVFDRSQYETEVRKLERDVEAWHPPATPDSPATHTS